MIILATVVLKSIDLRIIAINTGHHQWSADHPSIYTYIRIDGLFQTMLTVPLKISSKILLVLLIITSGEHLKPPVHFICRLLNLTH